MERVANQSALESNLEWKNEWHTLMYRGDTLKQANNWESAAVFYNQAFALAEKMLCKNCNNSECSKHSLDSYLYSALQLGISIKKSDYQCALIALVESLKIQRTEVNCDVEFEMYTSAIDKLTAEV